jgi:hypothetical protein
MFENNNKIEDFPSNNLEKQEEIKNLQELVEFFTARIKENLVLIKERISLSQKDKNVSFEDLNKKILANNNFVQKIKVDSFFKKTENKEQDQKKRRIFKNNFFHFKTRYWQ